MRWLQEGLLGDFRRPNPATARPGVAGPRLIRVHDSDPAGAAHHDSEIQLEGAARDARPATRPGPQLAAVRQCRACGRSPVRRTRRLAAGTSSAGSNPSRRSCPSRGPGLGHQRARVPGLTGGGRRAHTHRRGCVCVSDGGCVCVSDTHRVPGLTGGGRRARTHRRGCVCVSDGGCVCVTHRMCV